MSTSDHVRKIVEILDVRVQEQNLGKPFFEESVYEPFPFSKENFKPIRKINSRRKTAFVDGGNQEIFGGSNFSIQANRLFYDIFDGQKRVENGSIPDVVEFFSITSSAFKNGKIFYDTHLLPVNDKFRELLPSEADLSFNSFDRTVTVGTMRADIQRVASIARRFAEWSYAYYIMGKVLEEGDIIVFDGSLQTVFTNESKYTRRIYELAKSKGVIVTGLSKTCRLFTDTGLSLLGAIGRLAEDIDYGLWYFPVVEVISADHNVIIYVVKLNENAEYIFRFEIYREQFLEMDKNEVDEVFSRLAENSVDLSFAGYPYGLIVADLFSRIRAEEVEMYRGILLSEMLSQGKLPKFIKYVRTVDAHDVLNSIG